MIKSDKTQLDEEQVLKASESGQSFDQQEMLGVIRERQWIERQICA